MQFFDAKGTRNDIFCYLCPLFFKDLYLVELVFII